MSPKITPNSVLEALKLVRPPGVPKDIVSLGMVRDVKVDAETVQFTLAVSDPKSPFLNRVRELAEQQLRRLSGVSEVRIAVEPKLKPKPRQPQAPSTIDLKGIKHMIPVASGKGGVGKSTICANLALSLTKLGKRVGILDADIYGPSIPRILGVLEPATKKGNRIIPAEQAGVKVVSMDFFVARGDVAILRGPVLHNLLVQFVSGVEWGELDYLLIDLPPGTGDVQLSICQIMKLSGAVVVSTPQDVAVRIAHKAILMFHKLETPIIGIIENMSYYLNEATQSKDYIFGQAGSRRMSEALDIPLLGEVPLLTPLREASDKGESLILKQPESTGAQAFMTLAKNLDREVLRQLEQKRKPNEAVESKDLRGST